MYINRTFLNGPIRFLLQTILYDVLLCVCGFLRSILFYFSRICHCNCRGTSTVDRQQILPTGRSAAGLQLDPAETMYVDREGGKELDQNCRDCEVLRQTGQNHRN